MSKIYYYQQEVKIGDKVELNGHIVTVTEQLVKDLPDKFKVKDKPLFTTEDGVDIYEGDEYYWLTNLDQIVYNTASIGSGTNGFKCFSTYEAAEEYIAKHKEKTLEDYIHEAIDQDPALMAKLKHRYPKLFYTHILQKIANDLNNGLRIYAYAIVYNADTNSYWWRCSNKTIPSSVIFHSPKAAKKAIKIMGDKLDYIYKQ